MTINTVSAAQRLLGYLKPYRVMLVLSLVCAAIFGIVASLPSYALRSTIDDVFLKQHHHLIIPFMGLFLLFFLLKALFMYATAYTMHWVCNNVVNDIRKDLLDRLLHNPMSFFYEQETGRLMSSFLNDINMVQNAASTAIKNGVRSFFEALFLVGFACLQNWQLSLVMLCVGPAMAIVIKIVGKSVKKASLAIQQEMGTVSAFLQESFVGIRDIKACNGENTTLNRFASILNRTFKSIMRYVHAEALLPGLIEVIAMFGGAVVFYVACQQVIAHTITPGQLTAFIAALMLAYQPLKKIMNVYAEIQYGLTAADKIFMLMDKSLQQDEQALLSCPKLKQGIEFKDIACGYVLDKPVLSNVSLQALVGEKIGIVGPSGSGKSTLCDLLLGFIKPLGGSIVFDGVDYVAYAPSSIRQLIGYVGQRSFLFNDSVAHNVAYPEVVEDIENVKDACRAAHADEFIAVLPDGYASLVGENGGKLSGGQRQRLTIARALYKKASIFIFDEATSALDTETEESIRQTIQELPADSIVFIVSHRPALLANVDKVFMVDNGTIVQLSHQKHTNFYGIASS